MKQATLRVIVLGVLLFIASTLQFLGITVFGVVPNFVLATIVVVALFLGDIWHELFLVSLASFLLKFSPNIEREILAFFAVALLILIAERRLPWHVLLNGIFLAAFSTTLLYALIDAPSILSLMFAQELVYTIVLISAAYYGLTSFRTFRNAR